jgi:malate permease and related proteins
MTDIISQVLPILLLLGMGHGLRRTGFISETTVGDLRKIVVNLALPAVLFTSFLEVGFDLTDAAIVLVTFAICVVLYEIGKALQPRFGAGHEYFPFLMTGFESGMLGISLFGSAYGLSRVGYFAVVDLGHELFIWFVFLALLLAKRDGIQTPGRLLGAFVRSPVIIAILTGIAASLLGWRDALYDGPIVGGVMNTLVFLAALTVPLILLIVGYGIRLDRQGVREALAPVSIRLAIVLPFALLLPVSLVNSFLDGNEYSQAALFTLLILPPPFIIPLYMKPGIPDEQRYVNNVLSLYTVVSIGLFVAYVAVNPL